MSDYFTEGVLHLSVRSDGVQMWIENTIHIDTDKRGGPVIRHHLLLLLMILMTVRGISLLIFFTVHFLLLFCHFPSY